MGHGEKFNGNNQLLIIKINNYGDVIYRAVLVNN